MISYVVFSKLILFLSGGLLCESLFKNLALRSKIWMCGDK